MYYEKLAALARLNEDLKEFQDEESYKETKDLIAKNFEVMLNYEVKNEDYNEKVNQKVWEELEEEMNEEKEKAKLTSSRWLSDGTLECEYLTPDWETFTKVYQEDDFFARRQEEREEKIKESAYRENQAFTKFGGLLLPTVHQEKLKQFGALL